MDILCATAKQLNELCYVFLTILKKNKKNKRNMLLQSLVVIVRRSAQEEKERARQRLALKAIRGPGLMGKEGRMG